MIISSLSPGLQILLGEEGEAGCVCVGGWGAKVYTDYACWRDVQQMQ